MTTIKLVVDDGSGPLTCDRPGCDQPWHGEEGHQLPGGYRLSGYDDIGRLVIKLYCSRDCADTDR